MADAARSARLAAHATHVSKVRQHAADVAVALAEATTAFQELVEIAENASD